MFIQFEETPNPNTLKFLPGQIVVRHGTREFKSIEDCTSSRLAKSLFALDSVTNVFFGFDFISVTKSDEQDWDMLKPHVLGAIMSHFTSGLPAVEDDANDAEDLTDLDEISLQIKELIDTRVKPAVAQDGGNIEFVRYDEGIAYLRLEGACSGCPSSSATLKVGVESMLKHYVPELIRVEQEHA